MKLNPKLTGGLAWAGLIVVLAVPSADLLSKQNGNAATVITSDTDQIRTATVVSKPRAETGAKPAAVTEVATAGDPVDQFIKSGKKLPSYISDAPAELAEQKPAPTVKLVVPGTSTTASPAPMDVASVDPADVATPPQPYPASKRPRPPVVTTASVDTTPSAAAEQPLIIDEDVVSRRDAAVARVLEDDYPPAIVDGGALEEWDSGSLADYLERRGMMSGEASNYDEDGFFLDEGPNNDNARRRARRFPPSEFFLF